MKSGSFFAELKRRNVYKVAVAYVVAGWALAQGIAQVFPLFDVPSWALRLMVLLIVVGLPVALMLAWTFELTPQGVKLTATADAMPTAAKRTRHTWIYVVALGGIVSAGLFFLGRYTAEKTTASQSTEATADSTSIQKSIAVLPFKNLSRDPDNAYFAEGIQDEILTHLAKIADLKVIARTSTQKYKSAPDDLREVGKQLGVANILEGSVQRSGDLVHVNAQLIRADTNAHLWAESYDCKLSEGVFTVEVEVAQKVASALHAKLTGAEEQALAVKPTNNPEAYDAYLRGLAFEARNAPFASLEAAGFYERAVQLDPNFAIAWARLSRADAAMYLDRYDATTAARGEAAKDALENAQKLDPNSPETLLALGYYQYWV